MISGFIISAVIVLLDQLTKFLVYGTWPRSILGNFLWFQSTLNTGVAFSMFENMSFLFVILSSIAVLVLIFLIINKKIVKYSTEKFCLGLILGGTFSNLIDRFIFGGVRDFIYLKFMDFAIFNIADMGICIGAILLCVFILFFEVKNTNKSDETVTGSSEETVTGEGEINIEKDKNINEGKNVKKDEVKEKEHTEEKERM